MTTLRGLRAASGRHEPAGTMLLPPEAYATDYARRPEEPVAIGLRLLSESDVQAARAGAARVAVDYFSDGDEHHVERFEAYNDALMREMVARTAVDPNDARTPFFAGDEEEVREALTSEGVRLVYDELDRLVLERSPLTPEAGEDEVERLPEIWKRNLGLVVGPRQRHLRRLVGYVLRALLEAETAGLDVTDEED